jgi:DNA repair protein RadC
MDKHNQSDGPHYLGHRKRLKERFFKAPEDIADYEILELLLGYALPRKDTKPLAKELLSHFGSLKGVLTAKAHELRSIQGVGHGLEIFWTLWQEFWARLEQDRLRQKDVVDSPGVVAAMARTRIGYASKESFWIALVDNKNRLILFSRVGLGTVDQASVFPREIFQIALTHDASGIILVHNHPGGDPRPSSHDIELTKRIQNTASDMGLRVLDHVIVAEDEYYSFQGEGLL